MIENCLAWPCMCRPFNLWLIAAKTLFNTVVLFYSWRWEKAAHQWSMQWKGVAAVVRWYDASFCYSDDLLLQSLLRMRIETAFDKNTALSWHDCVLALITAIAHGFKQRIRKHFNIRYYICSALLRAKRTLLLPVLDISRFKWASPYFNNHLTGSLLIISWSPSFSATPVCSQISLNWFPVASLGGAWWIRTHSFNRMIAEPICVRRRAYGTVN